MEVRPDSFAAGDSPLPGGPDPDRGAVEDQLERILRSKGFVQSRRIQSFLRFIIAAMLSGDDDTLKESVIGVAVYGLPAGYDPSSNPIIRVEARRLRAKLKEYYGGAGRNDAVVIELPKGGYRPAVTMRPISSAADRDTPARRKKLWVASACFAAAAGCGAAIALIGRGTPHEPPSRSVTITVLPGLEETPSVAPDGSAVAFSWDRGGLNRRDIYVAPIPRGQPRRLTRGHGGDTRPLWSPDGSRIAFHRRSGDEMALYVADARTGESRRIGPVNGHAGAWTLDGTALLAAEPERIVLLPVTAGDAVPAASAPQGFRFTDVRLSPDGTQVAAVLCDVLCEIRTARFAEGLALGPFTRLVRLDGQIHGLAWTRHGRLVFSLGQDAPAALWTVDARKPGRPQRIPGIEEGAEQPAIGGNGPEHLVYEFRPVHHVWRTKLAGPDGPEPDTATMDQASEPLIVSARATWSAHLAPDGSKLAFGTARSGATALWLSDPDGSGQIELASVGSEVSSIRWSSDSQWIGFSTQVRGVWKPFAVSPHGGSPRQLENPGQCGRTSWSADNKWIYMACLEEGLWDVGRWEIWRYPAEGGPGERLTRNHGMEAREWPAAARLFFVKRSEPGLWSMPRSGGDERLEIPGVQEGHWDVTEDGVYWVDAGNEFERHGRPGVGIQRKAILFRRFGDSADRRVGAIYKPLHTRSPGFTVTPDGKWAIWGQRRDFHSDSDLMALLDFQ